MMLSLIAKEWRRLLRNPGMEWALLAYLLLPVLVAGAYLSALVGGQGIAPWMMSQIGGLTLNMVGTWQILMLAVAAPFAAAGLVAAEREEGTLAPLMAAGPPLWLLVLAKLTAVITFLLVLMLAGLPLFALPMLVGGVTWSLIGRTVLLEVATIAGMAGIGLLLSALGRRTGTVALVGVAIGVALTLGGGMVGSSAPSGVYNQDVIMMRMKMGMSPAAAEGAGLRPWLYPNPLVGLNSAINQAAGQGMFGLPGARLGPVYKSYRLWQVQAAGGWAVAVLSALLASLALLIETRWRWPLRRLRPKEGMSGV